MSVRIDPYRNFRFEVEIDGFVRAGFSKVSGLNHAVEVIDYREGGHTDTMHKLPGMSKFDDITLERGLSYDDDFVNWIRMIFDIDRAEGSGSPPEYGWRKDLVIYLRDKTGTRVKKWTVFNAWPNDRKIGDLDATSNEVLMSTLVLSHEGVREESVGIVIV